MSLNCTADRDELAGADQLFGRPSPAVPGSPGRWRFVTHSGAFHADDALAFAILQAAVPGLGAEHLTRTRDRDIIASADLVFDVGMVHDPERARFDHHMAKAPLRPDGTPYSSAGLIWKSYGHLAVMNLCGDLTAPAIDAVWSHVDEKLIAPIDRVDNGVERPGDLHLSVLVGQMNPRWDEVSPDYDTRFIGASEMVGAVLSNHIAEAGSRMRARGLVIEAAASERPAPGVLLLPFGMPWQQPFFELGLDDLFVVYPEKEGGWRVTCVPPEPGSFGKRVPFRPDWAGLEGEALQAASGVRDARFVHRSLFTGAAQSLDGALALARLSVEHYLGAPGASEQVGSPMRAS